MKFHISRTSQWDDKQPCTEAFRDSYTRIDVRGADDPAKMPMAKGKTAWWYDDGTNHRVENGHIKRDFAEKDWFIELADMDALLAFISTEGSLVIQPCWSNRNEMAIEIYDYYRE